MTSAPAVRFIFPVPTGSIVISAFDPLDAISFVVTEPAVISPLTVAPTLVIAPLNAPVVADMELLNVPVVAPKGPTSKLANAVSVIDVASAADVVVTALNLSSPSFQYIAALFDAPLLIIIPASISAGPELFLSLIHISEPTRPY